MIKTLTEQISCDWLRDTAATVPADQAIVEIGTYQGGSLKYLAEGARAGSNPKVYGVDAWGVAKAYTKPHLRRMYGRHNMALAAQAAPTAILIRDESRHAALHYSGPKIGLLFIDATHDYQNAMADFTAWRRHLAPNAWVIWDDYWAGRFDGVIQCVDELVAAGELTDFQKIGHHLAVTRHVA